VAFLEALRPEFKAYQQGIVTNAAALAKGLLDEGFRLVSGGTDNHLMLLDLRDTELTGKKAQESLDLARITTNRNTVPFDPRSPFVTSGVRIGTPAVTTRGMKEGEMREIAGFIARSLAAPDDAAVLAAVAHDVETLCRRFPIYPDRGYAS
jgi:glycine hydroxymethyltransferase